MDPRPAHAYRLPDSLRGELTKPFGPVVATSQLKAAVEGRPVLAVGDVVSLTCQDVGVTPLLFVCDYKTQRHDDSAEYRRRLGAWGTREVRAANPAATLTREAWDAVRDALRGPAPVRIVIDGEEDLLGLACLWEAPVTAVMLYGMPGKGVVVSRANAEMKSRVLAMLGRMTLE